MTINFSERMHFAGRSIDPEGRPAARIDFYGIVTAEMEDAKLHAKKQMIAFTDREVPLAQLGEMSKVKKKRRCRLPRPKRTDRRGNLNPAPTSRSFSVITKQWQSAARSILISPGQSSSKGSRRMTFWRTTAAQVTFRSAVKVRSTSTRLAARRRRPPTQTRPTIARETTEPH